MIISYIMGGTGNQLFQYAAGRRLAYKLNVELKLELTYLDSRKPHPYGLDQFNIKATPATREEIAACKKFSQENGLGIQKNSTLQEVLNYPDNVWLYGYWGENYFADVADVIRQDLTLKNPLSPTAETWKQKILSAECSVSMHFRHGDYVYNPKFKGLRGWADIPPFEVYCNCLNTLKQEYKNITVFVFSNNMPFIKENLKLDVPTEFVEGTAHDVEEIYLMSLCKHNVIPQSTFSWWGAWLNQNPDKKVFRIYSSTPERVAAYRYSLTTPNNDSLLDSAKWIGVPFDKNKCLENITMRPIFSLLLVVNNNHVPPPQYLSATLDSVLNQDYKYYEVIIIDNATTDGSDKICRQAIEGKINVTYKRLRKKIGNAAAWNRALKSAQGKYILFLKVGDRFLAESLTNLYPFTENRVMDNVIHMIGWLKEDESGNVAFADKKFSEQRDERLKGASRMIPSRNGFDAARLLLNRQINSFLGTKLYNVDFLAEHKIKFDETLADDEAEIFFEAEAFFKTKYFMYIPHALYVAPKS